MRFLNIVINKANPWNPVDSWTAKGTYGGWFHVYAFTMTAGVIVAIVLSAIKLRVRRVPVSELLIGAVVIVPASLLGASFVGKINKDGYTPFWETFFKKFEFWQGGMAIHGGVLTGLIVGLIIFHLIGRFKTRVSMFVYSDCIVPNILIGQAIGRWGNFFNHELYGRPVCDLTAGEKNPLSWLSNFILENTQFRYYGESQYYHGVLLNNNHIYQMEPLFLYESLSLFSVWLVVTFIIPGFGRWVSRKPWKLHPDLYKVDWKYSFKNFFTFGKFQETNKMTYYQVWNEAYYWTYDEKSVKDYEKNFIKYKEETLKKFSLRKWFQNGVNLDKTNNPDRYSVTRCGVETGIYFFGWNLVRFILEQRRDASDALINDSRVASNVIIIISFIFGIIWFACCQWLFPYIFRKENYRYEKLYFSLSVDVLKKVDELNKIKKSK